MRSSGIRWLDKFRLRLRSLTRGRRMDEEADSELAFHFEETVASHIAAGMSRADARRKARLDFGFPDPLREQMREARGVHWIENLARDVGYAWRGLRAQPAFALSAIAALALGAGFNAAVFTLLYSLLLRPLPAPGAASVFNVHVGTQGDGSRSNHGSEYVVSYPEAVYIRNHTTGANVGLLGRTPIAWNDGNRRLAAHLVSENYFAVIAARPRLGRFFTPGESAPERSRLAVLSHSLWVAQFASDPNVVGRTLILNRQPFEVIGVAEADVIGSELQRPDLWLPIGAEPIARPLGSLLEQPEQAWVKLLARRREGVAESVMTAELRLVAAQSLARHYKNRTVRATIRRAAFLNSPDVAREGAAPLGVLVAAVVLILLVACANVANMQLARGTVRAREVAIRLAIGASRGRILQQLLVESTLLALGGAIAGLALGQAAARFVISRLGPAGGVTVDLSPDWNFVSYLIGLVVLSTVVFGFAPAAQMLRAGLTASIKGDSAPGAAGGRWLPALLVGGQVAASVALLIASLVLVRGFWSGLAMDPGHARSNVMVSVLDLSAAGAPAESTEQRWRSLIDRVSRMPRVRSVSRAALPPVRATSRMGANQIEVDGKAAPGAITIQQFAVDEGYLRTMGIGLVEGREFTRRDLAAGARSIIVDQRLADRYFPGRSAIGRRINGLEVVGVAAPLRGFTRESAAVPAQYTPIEPLAVAALVVRYEGPREDFSRTLRAELKAIDPALMVEAEDIADIIEDRISTVKLIATIALAIGVSALLLACTGIYGLVSFLMSRRTREIGIRLALGGSKQGVVGAVARPGLRAILAGWLAGMLTAAVATRLLESFLYGLNPLDPVSFAAAGAAMALVAAISILVPVHRALRIDPARVLRLE
ncbi:MAG: ADOP family duplicated permease [Bryobacteraceae bacterium]